MQVIVEMCSHGNRGATSTQTNVEEEERTGLESGTNKMGKMMFLNRNSNLKESRILERGACTEKLTMDPHYAARQERLSITWLLGMIVQIAELRRQLDAKTTLQAEHGCLQEARAKELKNLAQGFAGLIADSSPTPTVP
jgi:hypothetical protein